jgi:hypothetical protein
MSGGSRSVISRNRILYRDNLWELIQDLRGGYYISHHHFNLADLAPLDYSREPLFEKCCFCGQSPPDMLVKLCTVLDMKKPEKIYWSYDTP